MFGLESQVKNEISELRAKELYLNRFVSVYLVFRSTATHPLRSMCRKRKLLSLAMSICNYSLPLLVMVITFGSYTTLQGGTLTSAKVSPSFPHSMLRISSELISRLFPVRSQVFSAVRISLCPLPLLVLRLRC
jgi:hypothetical protein